MKKALYLVLTVFLAFNAKAMAQTAKVHIEQDPMVTELVVLKAKMVKNNQLGHRYKIQLGSMGTLKAAKNVKNRYDEKLAEWPVQIEYEAPNYKIWVGDFTTKLAAERVFKILIPDFSSAIIFKPRR